MSLNQIIAPIKPIDAIFNNITVEGQLIVPSLSAPYFKSTDDIIEIAQNPSTVGIIALSGFNPSFSVNKYVAKRGVGPPNFYTEEVFLSFQTQVEAGSLASFDYSHGHPEGIVPLAAIAFFRRSDSITAYMADISTVSLSVTKFTFNFLTNLPLATSATVNVHFVYGYAVTP